MPQIVVLPGDGIGPEVTRAAIEVLQKVSSDLEFSEYAFGGAGFEKYGDPFAPEVEAAVLGADAVLLGAIGGPQFEGLPKPQRPEAGLLRLRKAMGVYANLRPVKVFPGLEHLSPLRPEKAAGVDILFVRELLGGLYFGQPRAWEGDMAYNTMRYTTPEVQRISKVAFEAARGRRNRVTSVDKANVLEVSELWRKTAQDLHDSSYPDVTLNHELVDSAAMLIVSDPSRYDVILTENLFGDILSDLSAVLPGSLGLLPSASLGDGAGLYEPIHGSAPDIAGKGIANPAAAILSAAMLLRHSLGRENEAARVESAVSLALKSHPTRDLGGTAGTQEFLDAVLEHLG
ncbi:MAG: 3-isopropylmalate dehydrogenase [Pseudopedobacter sp.]|nr:3-isopropylmalate dehydrogenase [Deinococcales bacterium]